MISHKTLLILHRSLFLITFVRIHTLLLILYSAISFHIYTLSNLLAISKYRININMAALHSAVQGTEAVLDYTFNNPNLLWEALQEAGSNVLSIGGRRIQNGNKRLAVFGDIVLDLVLANDWYQGIEPRGLTPFSSQSTHSQIVYRSLGSDSSTRQERELGPRMPTERSSSIRKHQRSLPRPCLA